MEERLDEAARLALGQIEDLASAAAQLVARGRAAYDSDPMLRLAAEAIMRRFSDAVSRLSAHFIAAYPSIRWHELAMTHDLDHGPGGNYDAYWDYLETRLPSDVREVTAVLDALVGP
jgi:uncharacterized protein with HEPN domain